jgi:signal peptidase I
MAPGTGVLDALRSVRNRDISGSDVILIGESALGRCVAVECLRRLSRALLIVDPGGTGQVFAERLRAKYSATPIQLLAEPTAAAVLAPDAVIVVVDRMLTECDSALPMFAATEWAKGRDCYVVYGESNGSTLPRSLNEEGVSLGKVLMHTPHRFTRMLELLEKTPNALAENAQNSQGFAVLERATIGGATDTISASAGEPPRKWRTVLIAWSLAVAISIGLFLITVRFRVTGASMEPTLRNGDYVLAFTTKVPLRDPQRGDIVIFAKKGEEVDYVKRVIGLPGEFVEIHAGRVWVDGQVLAEPYAQGATASDFAQVKLGPDEYFLLGDHRTLSRDSRNLGPVLRSQISGRAVLVCWPWSRWQLLVVHEQKLVRDRVVFVLPIFL